MNPWELIVQQPVINVLIVLSDFLADNFGLAIIALTVIVNLAMLPLTLNQIRSTKAMQELQPRLLELQKKYGKDRQKLAQEQMRLYRESGVRPAGCALTMLIQMPIWIAVYQSIMLSLAVTPEGLLNLSRYLYSWNVVFAALPLSRDFLWFNLAQPDVVLAVLVGATMWLQQRMSTPATVDPQQQAQTRMMLWMMPLLFTFLALSFPAGLSLYWVTSSVVRIGMQYRVTGWGGISLRFGKQAAKEKKPLSFSTKGKVLSSEDVGADISPGSDGEKGGAPKPSKPRQLPAADRAPRRRKR